MEPVMATETTNPAITRVGVIGAGQMGNGISHVCALAGIPVTMLDVKQDALDRAMVVMGKNLDRQVSKGLITAADKDAALGRIVISTDYASFGECDFVIEAATEKEDVKRAIYRTLTPHLTPHLHPGDQHLLHLDHPAGRLHGSGGQVHRHALHEPGADHEAGRGHPRHRHR